MQCIGYPKQQKYLLIAGCICCHVIALRIMRQSDKYFLPAQVSLSPRPPSATTPFTIPQLCESLTVWLLMIRRASISLSKVYHKTPLVSTMIFNNTQGVFLSPSQHRRGLSISRPLVQCLCAVSDGYWQTLYRKIATQSGGNLLLYKNTTSCAGGSKKL